MMNLDQLITLANNFKPDNPYSQESQDKREAFIERWPLEKISSLSIEEYADTFNKDCFIYWLERKMGGIGGGNASKFGIYRNNTGNYTEGVGSSKKELFGAELDEKFSALMGRIESAIKLVENNRISELNDFDSPLWNMVLNKILYLYFPDMFIDIGADKVLNAIAGDIGVPEQKNLIVTNHLIAEKLKRYEPFKDWPRVKYADFLWDTYNAKVFRNYYIIGSKYGRTTDVFPEMLQSSVIAVGYAMEHNLQELVGAPQREIRKFLDSVNEEKKAYQTLRYFLNLKPGDWVAVKSSGSPKAGQPFLSIVGIAEVVEDENFYQHDPDGLGQMIKVKFIKAPVHKEFDIGGYGATLHKITNNKHIDALFYSEYSEVQDEKGLLINRIIRTYKELIKTDNNKNELYKWRLVKDFQNRWNIDHPKFSELLKSLKFENLIYQNSYDLFRNSDKYPDAARELFEKLYNEEIDLQSRINEFQLKANEIFRAHLPQKKHSQDERAIATYLTCRYPDKYSFYKSSYYEKLLKLLGEELKVAGEKYQHYLSLVNDIRINYVLKDQELISISKETLTEDCYEDENRMILTQDIFYRVLDQTKFLKDYFGKEELVADDEIEAEELPLNLILYGPPGTGKTYKLRNYFFPKFTSKSLTKTKEEFIDELVEGYSWWQVISLVLADLGESKVKAIYDHPILQSKLKTTNTKTPRNTIWSVLQSHTKNDCPNVAFEKRTQPQFFWKDEDGNWSTDKEMIENEAPDLLETLNVINKYQPISSDKQRFIFTTFHQAYSYEDFIEGIKPVLEEVEAGDESIGYKIVPGVFKRIVQQAINDPENSYALFIDEINRGNVANVFGELITLIEDDKRRGAQNELAVTLPYSKESFSVPKNLHIIGTMNTADRSVEALDTALRRRFSFQELIPSPELITNHPDLETDLQSLLLAINQRIEKLLDKDHKIGHSYFMHIADSLEPLEELKKTFAIRILPLLHEYFYGDPIKIGSVLGEYFIAKVDSRSIVWPKEYEPDDLEMKEVYELADPLKFEDETPFIGIYEK